MLDLVIDRRASAYVIGGTICACSGRKLKIKGEVPCPVTGGVKEVEVQINVRDSIASKISFVNGTYIVAMVKPDMALDMMWDGAELDMDGLILEAFYVKTGGEIKMPENGQDKEKCIFIGEAVDVKQHKSGYDVVLIKLFNGQVKNLVSFTRTKISPGKKCAFLTGKGQANKNGVVYYPIEKQDVI